MHSHTVYTYMQHRVTKNVLNCCDTCMCTNVESVGRPSWGMFTMFSAHIQCLVHSIWCICSSLFPGCGEGLLYLCVFLIPLSYSTAAHCICLVEFLQYYYYYVQCCAVLLPHAHTHFTVYSNHNYRLAYFRSCKHSVISTQCIL